MKTILKPRTLGIFVSMMLWCSCATTPHPSAFIAAPELPVDVTMNKDAGCGNELFVTLRLESSEELPFVVDTGATSTSLDKSLKPKLGKRRGTMTIASWDGVKHEVDLYVAPKLYLGRTPLMTGSEIWTVDLKHLSSQACRPVMGVLGMDCLRHYCIQLDFEAGKLRFLDPDHVNAAQQGKAFQLTFRSGCPCIQHIGLLGGTSTNLLIGIDTGHRVDGALESGLFREVREQRLRLEGDAVHGQDSGRVWFSKCVWDGESYTNLLIGNGGNFIGSVIGLGFLARHLVAFDFPRRTMYLNQTSVGPLVDENMEAAAEFLKSLREKGQLPGWPENDKGTIYLEAFPNFEAFDGRKIGDSSTYHYKISRASEASPWKLQKAWRTDQNDKTVEEYSVP